MRVHIFVMYTVVRFWNAAGNSTVASEVLKELTVARKVLVQLYRCSPAKCRASSVGKGNTIVWFRSELIELKV